MVLGKASQHLQRSYLWLGLGCLHWSGHWICFAGANNGGGERRQFITTSAEVNSKDSLVNESSHKKIHVPCKDGSSRDIILAATLVQFGTKHIAIKDLDQHIAQGTECKVVALTLWKSEWNEEDWHNACSNTIRFIKDVFAKDNLAEAIVASWGRSTRNGKQVSSIHEATSIQIHSSIQAEKIHQVLAKSGFNRVWSTPKNEHGRLSDEYRVIWFEGDIHRAVCLAASLNGATGLIQGKKSFGLRFTSSAFSTAWKQIHPGQCEPEFATSSFVYKIEPLPFGCSPEQLKTGGTTSSGNSKQSRPQDLGHGLFTRPRSHQPPISFLTVSHYSSVFCLRRSMTKPLQ